MCPYGKKSGCVNYLILVWKKIDTDFFFREMYDFNFITTCKFALELGYEVQPETLVPDYFKEIVNENIQVFLNSVFR